MWPDWLLGHCHTFCVLDARKEKKAYEFKLISAEHFPLLCVVLSLSLAEGGFLRSLAKHLYGLGMVYMDMGFVLSTWCCALYP